MKVVKVDNETIVVPETDIEKEIFDKFITSQTTTCYGKKGTIEVKGNGKVMVKATDGSFENEYSNPVKALDTFRVMEGL